MTLGARLLFVGGVLAFACCGSHQGGQSERGPDQSGGDQSTPVAFVVSLPGGWSTTTGEALGPGTVEFDGKGSLRAPSGAVLSLSTYQAMTDSELERVVEMMDAITASEGSEVSRGSVETSTGMQGVWDALRRYKDGRPRMFTFTAIAVDRKDRTWTIATSWRDPVTEQELEQATTDWMPSEQEVASMVEIVESIQPMLGD